MPPQTDLGLVRADEPKTIEPEARALYDAETRSLESAQLREQINDLRQDRDQRKKYSDRLFQLVAIWLSVVGAIVLLQGFSRIPFALSVPVLVTLIGSTTASVPGLFAIVANYLFPKR